ncbi:MAG: MFS transporter [Candidatus Symbiothrix sp.]|jgi:fucose permease|nr:MFS transporter [Candidatus Symbiothrix sp.]
MKSKIKLSYLLPILFGFFIMGFVDVVNISVSYVKQDFGLSDKLANLLPMMVFLWFAVFSLPTGILMGKIGRKKTVLLSAVVTVVAMMIPLVEYSFPFVLLAFALLGIGNTILQVSLNPLVTNIVPENRITGTLTLGQFIKAVSSFLGPVIIGVAASAFGNWKLIFPVYAAATLLSFVWLLAVPIEETPVASGNASRKIFALLKNKPILVFFSIIVLSVGFEIGLMTATPKYLLERCSMPLEQSGLANSLYYAARTAGTFLGAFLLVKIVPRKFLITTMIAAVASFILLMLTGNAWVIMVSLALLGLTCANIFAIAFSGALKVDATKTNEISALMITGVAGGALLSPLMGVIADATNQLVSLSVLLVALIYILLSAVYVMKK